MLARSLLPALTALALALPGAMAASMPATAASWQPASVDQSSVYNQYNDERYSDSRYDRDYGQRDRKSVV